MKIFLFLELLVTGLLAATNAVAADYTSKCTIISDTLTDDSSDESSERFLLARYRIGGSHGYFDSLHFVSRNTETGVEKTEDLFVQSKRGGYGISYCNPDDHEYLESIEKLNWYSNCKGVSPVDKVLGNVSLSKRQEGSVKVTAYFNDGSSAKRKIVTSACK